MPVGQYLVGAFDRAATLIDREAARIDLSNSDRDNFVTNRITIRCEERVGLAVHSSAALVRGTFA
jgi:HK97 family phage major capsid protein